MGFVKINCGEEIQEVWKENTRKKPWNNVNVDRKYTKRREQGAFVWIYYTHDRWYFLIYREVRFLSKDLAKTDKLCYNKIIERRLENGKKQR